MLIARRRQHASYEIGTARWWYAIQTQAAGLAKECRVKQVQTQVSSVLQLSRRSWPRCSVLVLWASAS